MPKDQKNCPGFKAALESLLPGLLILKFPGREGLNSVFDRERFFESFDRKEFFASLAIEAEEIAPEGRGVEGNKSDLQKIEDIIPEISGLMANLLITNGGGEIDREQMQRISVKLGKLSIKLLEVSLDGGEISEDSLQVKLLRLEIDTILREVIYNR